MLLQFCAYFSSMLWEYFPSIIQYVIITFITVHSYLDSVTPVKGILVYLSSVPQSKALERNLCLHQSAIPASIAISSSKSWTPAQISFWEQITSVCLHSNLPTEILSQPACCRIRLVMHCWLPSRIVHILIHERVLKFGHILNMFRSFINFFQEVIYLFIENEINTYVTIKHEISQWVKAAWLFHGNQDFPEQDLWCLQLSYCQHAEGHRGIKGFQRKVWWTLLTFLRY